MQDFFEFNVHHGLEATPIISYIYITNDIAVAIRLYDTRCYFNVRSKADISQLNLPHGTDN